MPLYRILPNLRILDLSYNLIKEASNQEINTGKYLGVDLTGNKIRKIDGMYFMRYMFQNRLFQSMGYLYSMGNDDKNA